MNEKPKVVCLEFTLEGATEKIRVGIETEHAELLMRCWAEDKLPYIICRQDAVRPGVQWSIKVAKILTVTLCPIETLTNPPVAEWIRPPDILPKSGFKQFGEHDSGSGKWGAEFWEYVEKSKKEAKK